jgi:hypothetical protein
MVEKRQAYDFCCICCCCLLVVGCCCWLRIEIRFLGSCCCWLGLILVAYLLLLVGYRLLSVGRCFGRGWNSVFWLLLSVIC